MKCFGLVACLLGSVVACGARVPPVIEMADVTVVWPLPSSNDNREAQGFLQAGSLANGAALLSRDLFDTIPALTRVDEPRALYESLVVVGARLDPCFREGRGAQPCSPNLRLVFQPVFLSASGQAEARDASIHAFYAADNERQIKGAIEALAQARTESALPTARPLRVNPLALSRENRLRVRDILLPVLGRARLVRVTSVGVHAANAGWTFSGFDLANDGGQSPIVIPETAGATEQHLLSMQGPAISANVEPPTASADDFSLLLDDASARKATLPEREKAFDAAARIENPALHNPGTMDCVSCHLTAVARSAASKIEPLPPSPEAFRSARHDLTPTATFENPQMIRALGYRFTELVISPRTIHESASVADLVGASPSSESP